MLQYSRHLRAATKGSSFDYSTVRVISKWLTKTLENCSPHFVSLIGYAKTLEAVLSLSSGLGLFEIWSSFLGNRRAEIAAPEISRLDAMACTLKDVEGEYGTGIYTPL
jgi:midasin